MGATGHSPIIRGPTGNNTLDRGYYAGLIRSICRVRGRIPDTWAQRGNNASIRFRRLTLFPLAMSRGRTRRDIEERYLAT
jgi:hypothetical protein